MKDAQTPDSDLDASMLDKLVADKMELHCRQQLSAMLDGNLSPDEARFLLRRLQHDHELAACWERWQLCGDLMRGSAPAVLPSDFAQRVSAALAADVASASDVQAAASARGPRWVRWAGGAALAASVAATALFVVQRNPGAEASDPAPDRQVVASSPAPASLPQVALPEPTPTPPSAPSRPDQGGAVALAATAVAVAETPRRAARRNRAQAARDATTEPTLVIREADAATAIATIELPAHGGIVEQGAESSTGRDPFVGEVIAPARPWPRAVLPGTINDALHAAYGRVDDSAPSATEPGFEYFEPQLPVEPPPQP